MKILLSLCLLICFGVQCNVADPVKETLAQSSLNFSYNVYRALKVEPGNNVFFSPYSITNALGMLVLGSTGTTEADILKVLSIPDSMNTIQLHEQLHDENTKLSTEISATIGVANRFFVLDSLVDKVNPEYSTNLNDYYNATLQPTPFETDPTESINMVNNFVSENTHGEIPQLLSHNLPESTILALVNAIYFKGLWTTPFNKNYTQKEPFYTKDGDVQADFMQKTRETKIPYAECANFNSRLVSLSYTNDRKYAMVIVVPDEGSDLQAVEAQLDAEKLQSCWKATSNESVYIIMPRFSMSNHFSLKDMLTNLGATHIFGRAGAGNSKMFIENVGAFVDDIIHEAKVKVDEEGTVATAATAVIGVKTAATQPIHVNLDHPFLFFIADMSNDFVLFWGRVENPTLSS